jgi:rhomboid family GlyGly-CTERM serine protease
MMRIPGGVYLSAIVVLVLALELLGLGGALEYRRPLLPSEPWRLWTGHFVHLSLLHAILNCVALLLLGRLFSERLRIRELLAILGIAPLAISLVLWTVMPELVWYRGLSGALHSVYFAGCIVWLRQTPGRARWLPIAALAGGVLKVLLEQPWEARFPMHELLDAAVVPQAHLVGAVVGAAAGFALAARRHGRASDV